MHDDALVTLEKVPELQVVHCMSAKTVQDAAMNFPGLHWLQA